MSQQLEVEPDARVAEAVRELERELQHSTRRRWRKRLQAALAALLLIAAVLGIRKWREPPPTPRFVTEAVAVRDVVEQVQSTGTIKPLKEVQVGAQVSGRVVKVHVDFNSAVREGDLLAEIDPSLFGAQVSQSDAQLKAAEANVRRAEARVLTAKTRVERLQRLLKEQLATQADLDQAQGEYEVAEADVIAARAQINQLRAQLSSARTTLAYTRIYSPIDGVVINRAVDPGQTVAASFSAPVLFVIAQDLAKMQVMAEIDEADVGKLQEKMPADVVVDAFPGETFRGRVTQLRYSPNNVQGVVTYSAVVDVDNPELKLRPGMTATVTITTRDAPGVLAVRNSALRFRPAEKPDKDPAPAASVSKPKESAVPLKHGEGRIYTIAGGPVGEEQLTSKVVQIGISDGIWTELRDGGLRPGQQVVTEQREVKDKPGFRLF